MLNQLLSLLLSGALALSFSGCGQPGETAAEPTPTPTPAPTLSADVPGAVSIELSDDGVLVDGAAASADPASAVWVGNDIIYYQDGTDETYGEGSESEKHSAQEAAAHTVVTITQPGAYRLSGSLSQGQIFVDLGEDAKRDPNAVVTLILDNVDVTCTVAPALLFYRVFECNTAWVAYDEGEVEEYEASAVADTSAAGANVILAAGSENTFNGSHVARIYKEGTTKKLHKYDGAFYSKMSMNIYGDDGDDSGALNIIADNEGLNSEMHLTVNGGTISIQSQDDGINTNEDFVSVTTVNGGNLTINAGLGAEGDGIDSNGYLTINGGNLWTMSNERSPDGGIDADGDIIINGGTLSAFGTRNDAAARASAQPYMELSFASALPAGSAVKLTDEAGAVLWEAVTQKTCQAITLTDAALALDTVYRLYVDDVLQCYTGAGMGGFGFGGGQMPEGFDPGQMPEDFDPGQMPEGMTPPEGFDGGQMPEGMTPPEGFDGGQMPEGMTPPEGTQEPSFADMLSRLPDELLPEGYTREELSAMSEEELRALLESAMGDMGGRGEGTRPDGAGGFGGGQATGGEGETGFVLTAGGMSFSGVCDSAQSGKTQVSFTVEGVDRRGPVSAIGEITAVTPSVEGLSADQIQITVTDSPSEDYAESCLLSDGLEAVNALLPADGGEYVLTVAVVSGNASYTGAVQFPFMVDAEVISEE